MTSVLMSNCPAALSADQEPLTGSKCGLLPGPGPAARCGGGGGGRRTAGAAWGGRWRLAALLLAAAVAALLAAALVAEVVHARADRQRLRADVDDLRRRLHDRDLLAELRAFEEADYEEEAAMEDDEEDDVETDEDLQESLDGADSGSGTDEDSDESDESDEEYPDDDYLEYTLPAPVGAAAAETPDQRLRDKYADVLAGLASKLHEAKQAGGSKTSNLSSSSSSDEDSSNSSSSSGGARSRREISSASESGVPVIDESYGAPLPRAHNATSLRLYETLAGAGGPTLPPTDSPIKKHHRVSPLWSQQAAPKKYRSEQLQVQQQQQEWRGHRGGTPPPAPLITRASRVMDTDGGRSVRIPFTPLQHRHHHHQQQQQQGPADPSRPQELRQLPDSAVRKQHLAIKRKKLRALNKRKHPGTGTPAQHHWRPMPAAHFYGDSSNHTVDHDRYLGNGRLRPVNKLFTDWTPEDWFHRLGMDQHFTYEDGVVTVRRSGLYYVYAQIFYLDDKSTNGFKVFVDGEPKIQCSLHIHIAGIKSNTCFTASVMYINENSKLSVHDIEANRYSVFDKSKSFFGLVKLGNARLP